MTMIKYVYWGIAHKYRLFFSPISSTDEAETAEQTLSVPPVE